MRETVSETIERTKFKFKNRIIHSFVGGSELHGAKLEATDDHDLMGIYLETPQDIMGLDQQPHFVWSTAPDSRRNGPTDIDITMYGLNKWARLAVKGNPSILNYLFAPRNTCIAFPERQAWDHIVWAKDAFLARSHWKQFAGYAGAQLARMCGERSKKVNRPELVERYGFDTKFAMHTVRILSEGMELLKYGHISFPAKEVELLKEIRRGEVSQDWVIEECKRRMDSMESLATGKSQLAVQDEIDREHVSKILAFVYQEYWHSKGDQ
jgi:predicted nucleotidyltransferase